MEENQSRNYRVENIYGNVKVVRGDNNEWAVVDLQDKIIVPFGKYAWIDGFDQGLARVRTQGNTINPNRNTATIIFPEDGEPAKVIIGKEEEQYLREERKKHPEYFAKWGIINEKGEEVLPTEYDEVWNFRGKGLWSTKVEKGDNVKRVFFCDLNPMLPDHRHHRREYCGNHGGRYNGKHFGDFAGTYAQDYAGFSDEAIYDAFEGDPDAYWNID